MTLAGALPLVGSSHADAAGSAALEEPSPVEPKPMLPRNSATPNIVGGAVAPVSGHPWLAGLVKKGVPDVFCGATLIHA